MINTFREGDAIVTSKGLYGIVVRVNLKTCVINIGNKEIELKAAQLLLVQDTIGVIVKYTFAGNDYSQRVSIPRQMTLFNLDTSASNPLYDHCAKVVRTRYDKAIINLIKFA